MNKLYSVYYRTGGTENFKWQRTFETYTQAEARAEVETLARAGYLAHYALTARLDSIGLPDTYSA